MSKKRYGSKGQYIGILQAISEFNNGVRDAYSGTSMITDYMGTLTGLNIEAGDRSKIALRKLLKQLYKWENVEEFLSDKTIGFKINDYALWFTNEWNQIDHNLLIGRILDKYEVEPEQIDQALGFRIGQTRKWHIFNNLLWDKDLLEALREGSRSISFSHFVETCKEMLKESNV